MSIKRKNPIKKGFNTITSKIGKKASKDATSASKIENERKFLLTAKHDFYLTEAYKTLRTNVTFSLMGEAESKIITVTSAMDSEGKSISATNLAISFVEDGKKVLLIDCDLRKPKIGRLLQLKSEKGLTDVLIDPSCLEQSIQTMDGCDLKVLLSGKIPPNPSELLGSERMKALLDSLRDKYDYVLLDSPPVNMVTDAVVLSNQCDGMLFVVRAGQTERGALIHALDQLEYAQAKVLGFVMNGSGSYAYNKYKRYGYGRYGRYGHYGRRYGYGKYGYGKYGYRYGYGNGYGGYGYGYGYGYGSSHREEPEQKVPQEQ